MFPFVWDFEDDHSAFRMVFPFFADYEASDGDYAQALLPPLYVRDKDGDEEYTWLVAPLVRWGETPDSYADRRLMARGASTPSQTAWALLGLVSAGRARTRSARQGAEYLVETQRDDGNWGETEWTGTGFPRVLYLRYDQYRLNFPLLALGKLRSALAD